ncbi:hypothetical protein CVT26_001596 [Gymnopilus dilepis]|uniref:Nephrocystin 3-like N-terminal domain-containing protein n=1 Tax=Gymnopilus dilepis TaxID=231916 RepID=A0A409YXC4_9AGAR|nr:hypothetical protein CVT26_001596 [Gymnopilus dilepis]
MFNLGQNVSEAPVSSIPVNRITDPFVRLGKAVSPAAFHDSGARYDPPKCYPNTRLAVLEQIRNWVRGLDTEERDALIMWLHGPAGAGKSAIAQTIAEEFSTQDEILASYFFSRTDPTRNHARSVIATIAYQISIHFPTVRSLVEEAIRTDPLILTRSLPTQMLCLIVTPLESLVASEYFHASKSRRLIIIDGLDECNDRHGQTDILHTIAEALHHRCIPLKFLIASRPEHGLTHAFNRRYLSEISTRLALDDTYMPWDDIQVFLRGTFAGIKENHPFRTRIPTDWPADEEINYLVHKSSGQFIYAATVARFVESIRHSPVSRLEIVRGVRTGGTGQQMPFGELDALYHHIFSSVENPRAVLRLFSAVILWGLSMIDKIELLLGLSPGEAELLLCDISSLAYLQSSSVASRHMSETCKYVRFYHASLGDFLLDQSRSKKFYINVPLVHARLIEHAIQFLDGEFDFTYTTIY